MVQEEFKVLACQYYVVYSKFFFYFFIIRHFFTFAFWKTHMSGQDGHNQGQSRKLMPQSRPLFPTSPVRLLHFRSVLNPTS